MIKFFSKPYRWAACLSVILTIAFVFVLLDSFIIPRPQARVTPETVLPELSEEYPPGDIPNAAPPEAEPSETEEGRDEAPAPVTPVITDTSYADENIAITIEIKRRNGTTFYVADIRISDPSYLKTAFAHDTFGRNIRETTSETALAHDAIFAINGDYYGFRDSGYVLRNGILYRDNGDGQALLIDDDGNFSVINESEISADALLARGAWQIFSFGPALVVDGTVAVDGASEVSKAARGNPRTAIGLVSELHYIAIVSDGRTRESAGLSLLELAEEFAEYGCTLAYNLDGGGSSSMIFNGRIVNNPTDGRRKGERAVSDIVYIGYR